MRTIAGFLLATCVAIAPAAQAQLVCKAKAREAPVIAMATEDQTNRDALSAAFLLALTPKSFPASTIAAIEEPCTRGTFEAAGETYRVYGGFGDFPPRYALGPDPTKIAYVALGPPPAAALKWMRDGGRGGMSFEGGEMDILAVTNGDTRDIYALFEDLPGDAQLIAAFRDALEGRLPKIASFNVVTGKTTFAGY